VFGTVEEGHLTLHEKGDKSWVTANTQAGQMFLDYLDKKVGK